MWQLVDNSDGERKGWLSIMRDGVRVADAFPYAANADASFVREQAQLIVDTMNRTMKAVAPAIPFDAAQNAAG